MEHSPPVTLTLYGQDGRRKYLTPRERLAFIAAAQAQSRPQVETLCLVIAFTGCRISEALALRRSCIECDEAFVAIRSLKKRGRLVIREIPIPRWLVRRLAVVHGIALDLPDQHLWSWSRTQAWFLVKRVMVQAGIRPGPHASPKGLRHAFGVHAIRSGVPLNLLQRWLGHARITTTAIYAEALGPEEREIAARMWGGPGTHTDNGQGHRLGL